MISIRDFIVRMESMVVKPFDDNIFFLHFEKCGGTSIQTGISDLYKKYDFKDLKSVFHLDHKASLSASKNMGLNKMVYREFLLEYYLSQPRIKFIRGHFQINMEIFKRHSKKWNFITMLRDPESRFLSHYFFNFYKNDDHDKIHVTLDEYLDSDRALAFGQDYVSNVIGNNHKVTENDVKDAIEILNQFKIVGLLEYNTFNQSFFEQFGRKLPKNVKNVNPIKDYVNQVTKAQMNRVKEICTINNEVYKNFCR